MAKDLQFTFKRPCLEISGEIGSLAELIGYMQEESATLTLAFGDDMELVVQRLGGANGEPNKEAETAAEPAKKRGRPAKAAPEAVAPEPLPVPSQEGKPALPLAPPLVPTVTVPPPNATTVLPPNELALNANGVPAFLDASTRAAAPAAAPPPPPSLPPVGTLGPKVVAALDERAKGSPDGGQALADWLAGHGLTLKGATFSDACRAVLMMRDDKLTAAAAQLGIS